MTFEDQWHARHIPDGFVRRSGNPVSRISKIVTENWWSHDARDLARLVDLLLPVLEPISEPGAAAVTEDVLEKCVAVVDHWLIEVKKRSSGATHAHLGRC